MSFFKTIFSVLFPDSCVGCSVKGTLLCGGCAGRLPPAGAPRCSFITSIYAYQDHRIRKLVRLLKYKNTRHIAEIFAPALARSISEFLGEEALFFGAHEILIVPIPLSKKRMRERGYNQAELIARCMLEQIRDKRLHIDVGILQKTKETKKQADIKKRSERLSNLGECFSVKRECLGESIILIDDVTTTGATLTAARRVLRAAGFVHIHAFTIAH